MELICIFLRDLHLNWLKYPLLFLIGSHKFGKCPEIKVLCHETICQNIKKMTGPPKIRSYNNMNNHFHQCIKSFQMEGIFGPYLPIVGPKIIEDKPIACYRTKEYLQNCILQLLTRKLLILKNIPCGLYKYFFLVKL